MKKALAFFVLLVFVLSAACMAFAGGETWHCDTCDKDLDSEFCPDCGAQRPSEGSTGPWPVRSLDGEKTSLKKLSDDEQRHQSYYGPGKDYHGGGAYQPRKVSSMTAILREGSFVLVDMSYRTVGRRCLYFRASSLTANDVKEEVLKGYPAKTTQILVPLNGPGPEYDTVTQTVPSKYADYDFITLVGMFGGSYEIYEALKPQRNTIYLDEGTEISVFFETNGWVFAEFDSSMGSIRAFLPANSVTAQ